MEPISWIVLFLCIILFILGVFDPLIEPFAQAGRATSQQVGIEQVQISPDIVSVGVLVIIIIVAIAAILAIARNRSINNF